MTALADESDTNLDTQAWVTNAETVLRDSHGADAEEQLTHRHLELAMVEISPIFARFDNLDELITTLSTKSRDVEYGVACIGERIQEIERRITQPITAPSRTPTENTISSRVYDRTNNAQISNLSVSRWRSVPPSRRFR